MDETTLRELLGSALAGEPPIGPVAQNALRAGIKRRRRVRGAAGGVASILLVAGVAGTALGLGQHGAPAGGHPGAGQQPSPGQQLSAAAAARARAVKWVLREVSRAVVVGCDPLVCTDLTDHGFPAAAELPLGSQSTNPDGSTLVVATPAIQAQFGNRLASVYAPAVIASFGSGRARIDIRLVFPGGATGYRAAQQADLSARKAAEAQLLTNGHITFSAAARTQLGSGDIDPRLPMLLAMMVHGHPVHIVDFGGWSPGGGPASLLRWVDLAPADPAARLSAADLSWVRSFVRAQRAQYRHARVQRVMSSTGQAVLRIEYLAPSPLAQP
jgi:hypothetical protein